MFKAKHLFFIDKKSEHLEYLLWPNISIRLVSRAGDVMVLLLYICLHANNLFNVFDGFIFVNYL